MNEFFDLIAAFFAQLTNEEKILLGILSILVFLIGVVVGWIVQGSKTRRYKKELLLLRKDRDEYEVRYRAGETKIKALAKELEAMSEEKVAALDRLHALEAATTTTADGGEEDLLRDNAYLRASVEELETQVRALEADNLRLRASGGSVPVETSPAPSGSAATDNDSLNAYIAHNESRLQALEDRLRRLDEEYAALRQQEAAPRAPASAGNPLGNGGYTVQPPTPASGPDPAPAAEPLIIRADTTEPGIRTGHAGTPEVIVQTTPSIQVPPLQAGIADPKHDDLTRIDNIGPFLQAELNKADIFSYRQIAGWTEADIVTYTELIGYLPGIIQRDDWVGQAQRLLEEKEATPAPDPVTDGGDVTEEDEETTGLLAEGNLRLVEGIGPKIEGVLKAAGVDTLDKLAETPADRLREILDAAGSQYKAHDPKTWPVQAGLAADGKLVELQVWQRELKSGE